MDWSSGYSSSYHITLVDPGTWRSLSKGIEVVSGKISRSESSLMESADITCGPYPEGVERWIRIWLDTRQENGAAGHQALFTGLATSPEREMDGLRTDHSLQCYSVLKPASDILLPRGWYVLAGKNGAEVVRDLLMVGPAPVEIEAGAPALSESIVAEDGETNLTMASKILQAIDWRLRINGMGIISICPQASEASEHFGENAGDCIELAVTVTHDRFSCPNIFRAVVGGISAVAIDSDPDSELSTVGRGREIWAEELSPTLGDNESIDGFAARRLEELQRVSNIARYYRRYYPDVLVGDLIDLNYPRQNLVGLYKVSSQSIELGYNARTTEEVIKV